MRARPTLLLAHLKFFKTSSRDFTSDSASQRGRKRASRVQNQRGIPFKSETGRIWVRNLISECHATVDWTLDTIRELMVGNEDRSSLERVNVNRVIPHARLSARVSTYLKCTLLLSLLSSVKCFA
jgi:hypothetical protein